MTEIVFTARVKITSEAMERFEAVNEGANITPQQNIEFALEKAFSAEGKDQAAAFITELQMKG